jgi:uncharacterized protein YuzE
VPHLVVALRQQVFGHEFLIRTKPHRYHDEKKGMKRGLGGLIGVLQQVSLPHFRKYILLQCMPASLTSVVRLRNFHSRLINDKSPMEKARVWENWIIWRTVMANFNIDVDASANAAYVKVKDGEFGYTQEVSPVINFDIDPNGRLLGIEFLNLESFSDLNADDLVDYVESELASELEQYVHNFRLN